MNLGVRITVHPKDAKADVTFIADTIAGKVYGCGKIVRTSDMEQYQKVTTLQKVSGLKEKIWLIFYAFQENSQKINLGMY